MRSLENNIEVKKDFSKKEGKSIESYQLGDYTFHEIHDDTEIDAFEELWYGSLHEVLDLAQDSVAYQKICDLSKQMDKGFSKDLKRVLALSPNGEVVGTMGVYVDRKGILPAEIKETVDFTELRKSTRILEVGRMSIHSDFRQKALLSFGLNMFILFNAIKYNVDLIIESAFPSKLHMFERIGFRSFKNGVSYDKIYGIYKKLCYYHFTAKQDGFFNPENPLNKIELSNYTKRIFQFIGEKKLNEAYQNALKRNTNIEPERRSYNRLFCNSYLLNNRRSNGNK